MSDAVPARILIADDEPLFLRTTAELLRKAGYDCTTASNGRQALEALTAEPFDLVLSDLNMPGNLKLELLREERDRWPDVPLIVITGVPSLPSAIESVRLGITDYLLKPVKYEDLLSSVRRAIEHRTRSNQESQSSSGAATASVGCQEIVGKSPPMRELCEVIERVAETDANVLISGESGTGKEIVAHAIHRRSRRAECRFQVIDCTAIPETLFESVLFGHAKGAFTGAVSDQMGLLTQADGGTVFFDEIGELPLASQAKLLRVVQEQTFTPVGKTAPVHVETRIICATNRDLELEVHAGRFRRDLFYRLAVINMELPPLRDRSGDVILLARHFLQEIQGSDKRIRDLSQEAQRLLNQYEWPGNIRELRNVIERGIALARTDQITPADLPLAVQNASRSRVAESRPGASPSSRSEAMDEVERDYLIKLLQEHSGNVSRSADQAGMSRQGLHKLLKKHGLDAGDYRP